MKLMDQYIFRKLELMIRKSLRFTMPPKVVIFSDLHMGNGGRNDDFAKNADLFTGAINYYRKYDYSLILNGDIEELQRSSLDGIQRQWKDIYEIFDVFHAEGKLKKTIGNHDSELAFMKEPPYADVLFDCFSLQFGGAALNFFHGHQASYFFEKFNTAAGKILRYAANPLRIQNMSHDITNTSRFQTERRVYLYGKLKGAISVIGHTHRPLFDSMDKADHLRLIIEKLIREFVLASEADKDSIRNEILEQKRELERTDEKKRRKKFGVYNTDRLVVPCVFNSGTVIAKSGMTCLEIDGSIISLSHWFDSTRHKKYLDFHRSEAQSMDEKGLYRVVLDSEDLHYIIARTALLTEKGILPITTSGPQR